jgi:hypothetical protein
VIPQVVRGELALESVFDVCSVVDELEGSATGELVVQRGGAARGTVFVERGRVCWAAARGLARRLTELLGERASLPPADMERMFLACKSKGVPIGEHLVACGALRADDLRAALLDHTVESLDHLVGGAQGVWRPRAGKGYSPRFTFTSAELLVRSGALRQPATARAARGLIERWFAGSVWAAAFARTASSAYPQPIASAGAIPCARALIHHGRWAVSTLDVVHTFSGDDALLSVIRSDTSALVALHEGACVVVGESDAQGPARILNRRRARGGNHGDL